MSSRSGEEKFVPRDDEDQTGTIIRGEERDEGVGELTPLPDDAGGDPPPSAMCWPRSRRRRARC